MTKLRKWISFGAMAVSAVAFLCADAQNDLDDLLKELESDVAKPAAKAEAKPAEEKPAEAAAEAQPASEEAKPAAEEKPAEEAKPSEEKPAEEAKPAEEEKPAEEAKPAEAVAEAPAEEKPAEEAKPAEAVAEAPAEAKPAESAEETASAEPKPKALDPKPATPPDPDAELLENIRATELLRRTALDTQAKREIESARAAMESGEYSEAVRHYGLAQKLLNDSEASAGYRRECEQGIAEGLYRTAMKEDELGRREKAVKLMEKAMDMHHPKAKRILDRWLADDDSTVAAVDSGVSRHRISEEDFKTDREQIRHHLRRSRQYLAVRDMKKALEECEIVLVKDPYNQDAIRIRSAIQRKRQTIREQERETGREGMIADVDEAWRPVYAVNAARLSESNSETMKSQVGEDPERTKEQNIERRMKEMRLPNISFKPPATIQDAVEFFRVAGKDYDRPDIPIEKRGFNFWLRTPKGVGKAQQAEAAESDDFSSNGDEGAAAASNGLEPIQPLSADDISFYDALKIVCDSVGYKFIVRGEMVIVMPRDMSTAEILSRKYNVPESFMERVSTASDEMKQMGGFGGGNNAKKSEESEETPDRDWKAFFGEMGVSWPEGSSIKHIKSLGKLYVRNTRENLAEFEKVLDELGGQPQLIEIETRFVEVSQEDLNSLGFEWILNSDYSLDIGSRLGKALGIRSGTWGSESGSSSISQAAKVTDSVTDLLTNGQPTPGYPIKSTESSSLDTMSSSYNRTVQQNSKGASWIRNRGGKRNIGINAFGGTTDYSNGNRYLSTVGNHISGESESTNDQFMRVNAFLGQADLSMILHMLSQRSDTDLLSAPKVVTKSGENAVIKVVTEYIYPQDYDVQLQSSGSSSSGGSSGSGGSSAILAVVEPQNFTMREVGVILDVTPTYSEANGGTIDLELKPQVVDEPTWHNYGMKIPFSGNSSIQSFAGLAEIPLAAVAAVKELGGTISDEQIQTYSDAIMASSMSAMASSSGQGNMTWYDAPMEQPFFHVRSIDSKVSITPGATVVMGGLITEQRKAMDDKIPFLGDLPYVGRFFRSHAEQTLKRNLLIFVTGRLITPSGRELRVNKETADEAEVKAAPKAE